MSRSALPEADSRLAHVKGIVLCTGGTEPLHGLRFGEHTLAERAAALLVGLVHDVVWVGAEPPSGALGRAAAPSTTTGPTHAAGSEGLALLAALEAVPDASVLVVSADRPLLSPDLLIGLAGRPDAPAGVPRVAGGPHLLCARYDPVAVLPELRRCIAAADPTAFLAETPVQWLEGEALAALDPDGSKLRRIESAAALERLAESDASRTRGFWPGHPGLDWTSERTREIEAKPRE